MEKSFTILSIEDNEADFVLLCKALGEIKDLSLNIINVNNGQDALDFMYKKGDFSDAPTPDIIILDINLPKIDGKVILKSIKEDEKYKVIPIIIFSTSENYTDIEEAYKLYANSYIIKECDYNKLYKKISLIGEYWLKANELPDTDNNNFYFINRKDED